MANKHTTLTSLFSAIAEQIRRITQTQDVIVADDFPEKLKSLPSIRTVNDRFRIGIDGITLHTFGSELAYTPTVFEYYGGYLWMGGNDASGCGYVSYSSDLTSWKHVKIHPSRVHPVHALGFDLDAGYVYVFGDTTGYSSRTILRLNDFFNYPTNSYNYNYWTHAYAFTDATTYNGTSLAVNGTKTMALTTVSTGALRTLTYEHSIGGTIEFYPFRCCAYDEKYVCISADGYYSHIYDNGGFTWAKQFSSDTTCCDIAQMGEYLCVLGTKTDGTYLYYTDSSFSTWNSRKILDTVVTPVRMAYANDLYVVAYNENDELCFWVSSAIDGNNELRKISFNNGDIADMATDGNTLFALTNDGSYLTYTVPTV